MPSLRQLRQRLRSIQGTRQIMRAMQLVSGSKLKRAQLRLQRVRQVMDFLGGVLGRLVAATEGDPTRLNVWTRHPLCERRDEGPSALVLITSDAGLCGAYNANLLHLAASHLARDSARRTHVIYIGKKGHRALTKRGWPALAAYLDLAGRPDLDRVDGIGRWLMEQFLARRVSAIHLLYAKLVSAMASRPTVEPWLPMTVSPQNAAHSTQPTAYSPQMRYIVEPSPARMAEELLPRWALAHFQCRLLEAFTSEHSARMLAMKNATDNAEELLKGLTLQRNKVRQAMITKEISEIVGTADALK
jgi:F-type H+-transporting ATPase subunit gamma